MSYGFLRRLSPSALSVVIEPTPRRSRPLRLADVERGWVVLDLAGRRIGHVERIDGDTLVVARGAVRRTLVLRAAWVRELHEGTVRLALPSEEIG